MQEEIDLNHIEIICITVGNCNEFIKSFNLIIPHLNVRSLCKHIEEVCLFIQNLERKPLLCTETWSIKILILYKIPV